MLKTLLLILFFPLWIVSLFLTALIILLGYLLGWIPFIGTYMVLFLMSLEALLYPILTIYGLGLVSFGKESIGFSENGFFIKRKKKEKHIKWEEINKVYDVFEPPGYAYRIELNNGEIIKFNVFTEVDPLINEIKSRDIQLDIKQSPSRMK